MADIRMCGPRWVYLVNCDGNCSTCQKTTTTSTTPTTPPNFVTGTSHYPVSNADRIRAMSDEELAKLLVHNPWMREESALDWLKSPVKGVTF